MINTAEIQARIERCGYTYGRMALEISDRDRRITEREMRDIVDGKCIPSWEDLVRIANLLGCSPRQFIISERR